MIELLLAQAGPTPTEIQYAETLGMTQGEFYCQALRAGVRTKEELGDRMFYQGGAVVLLGVQKFTEWSDKGQFQLIEAFLSGLETSAHNNCSRLFTQYLDRNFSD